ncbi:MAG: CHC2 zinc finger domain-containing protein [Sedimenticola sp.]
MTVKRDLRKELSECLVLSEIVKMKLDITPTGREYKASCPFHQDKEESFYINNDRNFFHCFSCGAHGDVIDFIMNYDDLSFKDVMIMLANETDIDIP